MAEGRIEVRRGAPDGPLLASASVDPVGTSSPPEAETSDDGANRRVGAAPDDWTDVTMPVTDPRGPHTLYLVVRGQSNDPLLKMDWLRFDGPGMMMRESPQAEE
jgi:hypothetical protein